MKRIPFLLMAMTLARSSHAATILVVDVQGKPLPLVMVTEKPTTATPADTSDNGYQKPGVPHVVETERTGFTNGAGQVQFPDRAGAWTYRFRKPGHKDEVVAGAPSTVAMKVETDPVALAAAKPANVWLGALDVGGVEEKKHFQMQCGFCHQQGNQFTRGDKTPADWKPVIDRMVRYGSRLPSDLQKSLPEKLSKGWAHLRENPALLAEPAPWNPSLSGVTITEWPIGDIMSQVHDMLIGANGLIYVADNIQDRLYEVNAETNAVTVYKIPHKDGDSPGGLLAGRLKEFPRHDSTSNAHSLALSPKDGHIFITPSAQRRLVEFDPATKAFELHEIGGGFYPHTIRTDAQDRVWFTLALSNQVGKFDRVTRTFTLYDLPTRSRREELTVSYIGALFKLISWGVPLPNWLAIDWDATGTPMPYGIDVTPDGSVWFARLHTREIGKIDPATGAITMVPTPFLGPRRLRSDAQGNLWIVSYAESKIAKYDPREGKFTQFDLPVVPVGSDTPYSLNVDRKRGIVWVNGNQSDSLYMLDIATQAWRVIPMPRRTTFTRDIEVTDDGAVYTSISNFPSWHVEGMQPTLIRVEAR
jgi:streptogramin lyase